MIDRSQPGLSIDCVDLVDLVTDYLEGALDQPTRAEIEAHLALGPGCDTYLMQMRETIRTLGQVPVTTLSDEAAAGLLSAFRDFHAPDLHAPDLALQCQEVVELVTDFLENARARSRRSVVLEHLRDCDDCLRYFAQLQITQRLLADAPVDRLSEGERDALLRAYREWRAGHRDDPSVRGASRG